VTAKPQGIFPWGFLFFLAAYLEHSKIFRFSKEKIEVDQDTER
jgi:hypothetical protein